MGSVAPRARGARNVTRSAPGAPLRRRCAVRLRGVLLGAAIVAAAVPFAGAAGQAAGGPALAGSYTAGPLRLAFDTMGVYRVSLNGVLAVEGGYEIHADTVVLHDRGGPRACPADVAGTYAWKRSGGTLTLGAIADGCAGRQGALAREWAAVEGGAQALVGLTLIDGTGAPARSGMTLLVEKGRIRDVFPDGAKPLPVGTERADLRGRWVIPGLIDAHVHLETDPSGSDGAAAVATRLRNALLGGVTTVRDMGGDTRVLAGLARAAALNETVSPSVVYAAVFAGPEFFGDPRIVESTRGATAGAAPWARAVRGDTDLRLAVAEAKGTGASALKLYAALPAAALVPLVGEAHRQGLAVWSHAALFPARPSEVVDAGVDVVSHASLLVWEAAAAMPSYTQRAAGDFARVPPTGGAIDALLKDMAQRGTILDATLLVVSRPDQRAKGGEWASRVTGRAHELGVRIAAGTDGFIGDDNGDLPNLHEELALLVRAGLAPLEAISAATSVAAAALDVENDRGVLAPGMAADLVILERDPLVDIRNSRSILWVMKAGRRYSRSPVAAP